MNRSIVRCCKVVLNSNKKAGLDKIPRCFSSQNIYPDDLDKLGADGEKKKSNVNIFKTSDAIKFKKEMLVNDSLYDDNYIVVPEGSPHGPEIMPLIKIGTRVRRGYDWEWRSQDGYSTNVEGEVISEVSSTGWVRVKWDHGGINSYRMGNAKKYDLLLALPRSKHTIEDEAITREVIMGSCSSFDSNLLPSLLSMYYSKLFPVGSYFKWLSYNQDKSKYFIYRELCFTMPGDIFHRYKSFINEAHLKDDLVKKCPEKVHLGAVYSDRPQLKKHKPMEAIEKELVFDIDANVYNDVRNCCSKDEICNKCWKLMAAAVKILERSLKEDFGFKHILWVFSGRRGIHCWVCDAKARTLSTPERKAILNFLHVENNGCQVPGGESIQGANQGSHIQKSVEICNSYLEALVHEQDLVCNAESLNKIFHVITDVKLRVNLSRILPKYKTSVEKWKVLYDLLVEDHKRTEQWTGALSNLNKLALELLYPRLDENVSIPLNHLLKSPFSVHPKTGRVCIPFSSANVDSFDPTKVPHLSQLQDEINEFNSVNLKNTVPDYMKTSLQESFDYFAQFLSSLCKAMEEDKKK